MPYIESEQAMQQVLQAERDAERAIHDCENEAQQSLHDGQISAQRIHVRANQRISNMEMRYGHLLDQLIRDIEREGSVELINGIGQPNDQKNLVSVVEKLAVELCCGDLTSDGDTEADR